ncbi:MAG: hypothetical protein IPG21_04630 [Saprospiraceae bacterium]|nr:hypothetical protein [Candidatus Vicinibacter affinis]
MNTSQKLYHLFGDPFTTEFQKKYLHVWDVPTKLEVGLIPKKIYCHASFAPVLEKFFKLLIERQLTDHIKTWDGCYNLRPIRGYEKHFDALYKVGNLNDAMKYLSCHSWGSAIDINAAWNQLGKPSTQNAELVKAGKEAGYDLGRRF